MAYNFGQYRRQFEVDYISALNYSFNNSNKINQIINLTGENILKAIDNSGKQKSYFLDFNVENPSETGEITIKLKNSNDLSIKEQIIKTIKTKNDGRTLTISLVITPKANYNQICLELNQNQNIVIDNLSEFNDIVQKTGHDKFKQIGVQGPAGLLMSVNGEEVKIGRSGIYEINYGASITSLGIALTKDNKDNFILDYQY